MMRVILCLGFYIICLGLVGVEVQYTDGLKIKLNSWPDIIKAKLDKDQKK